MRSTALSLSTGSFIEELITERWASGSGWLCEGRKRWKQAGLYAGGPSSPFSLLLVAGLDHSSLLGASAALPVGDAVTLMASACLCVSQSVCVPENLWLCLVLGLCFEVNLPL